MRVKISAKELEDCLFDLEQLDKFHIEESYKKGLEIATNTYNSLAESNLIDENDYERQVIVWPEFSGVSYKEIMSCNRLKDQNYVISLTATLDIQNMTIEKEELVVPTKPYIRTFPKKN